MDEPGEVYVPPRLAAGVCLILLVAVVFFAVKSRADSPQSEAPEAFQPLHRHSACAFCGLRCGSLDRRIALTIWRPEEDGRTPNDYINICEKCIRPMKQRRTMVIRISQPDPFPFSNEDQDYDPYILGQEQPDR